MSRTKVQGVSGRCRLLRACPDVPIFRGLRDFHQYSGMAGEVALMERPRFQLAGNRWWPDRRRRSVEEPLAAPSQHDAYP